MTTTFANRPVPCSSGARWSASGLVAGLVLLVGVGTAPAQVPPTIDGNITDMQAFANALAGTTNGCGQDLADDPADTRHGDVNTIPCVGPQQVNGLWANGIDITRQVFAYKFGTNSIFLGLRALGNIGDADGNGSPTSACGGACNPGCNIVDPSTPPGIGPLEVYSWDFDLDCDLGADAFVILTNNTLTFDGFPAGTTGSFNFNTTDLEVEVVLPAPQPTLRYLRFFANMPDGKDEDGGPGIDCAAPADIDVEKVATPSSLCPNQETTFTTTVDNTGLRPLSVVVVDNLPAGLTYVVGSSGGTCLGATQPTVVSQQITWPPFQLDPGEDCTITFRATASASCSGPITNSVTATGAVLCCTLDECTPTGLAVDDTDTFPLTCLGSPCVDLTCSGPPAACPGQQVSIHAEATNCRTEGAETIVITIAGQPPCTFTDVPAGESRSCDRTVTMPACTGPSNSFPVSAVARVDDCPDSPPENCTVTVRCDTPSLTVVKTASVSTVLSGGTVTYTMVVTNGPTTLENIVVEDVVSGFAAYANNATPAPDAEPAVGGQGTVRWTLASLPAGASRTFEFDVTLTNPQCPNTVEYTNRVDVDGVCGTATAHADDEEPVSITCQQEEGLCRLTGGGCLNEEGDQKGRKRHTFGGNASPLHMVGGPTGNEWQHVVRTVPGKNIEFNFHSHDAHVVDCSIVEPGPCSPHGELTRADFEGTGMYSEGSGAREFAATFTAIVIDHHEGSCERDTRDEYFIEVVDVDPASPKTGVVFTFALQRTDCGNLQIHETPVSIFGGLTATVRDKPIPAPDDPNKANPNVEPDQVGGLTVLNRAAPNPFSGTVSYSYRVPGDGGDRSVDVGVYSVTGRLVSRLASGAQPAGTYTVRWDGKGADGVKMAQGVYFLRARVGTVLTVTRVVYLK